MAITVHEKWESRQSSDGENPSVDLRYIVNGTDDDLAAKTALTQASPVLYDGLVRQSTHIERIAEAAWEGSVRYGKREPPKTGDSSYQFDTGGGRKGAAGINHLPEAELGRFIAGFFEIYR